MSQHFTTFDDFEKIANTNLIISVPTFSNGLTQKNLLCELNKIILLHDDFYDKMERQKNDYNFLYITFVLSTVVKSKFKISLSNYLINFPNLMGDKNIDMFVQEKFNELNKIELNSKECTNILTILESNSKYFKLASELYNTIKGLSIMRNFKF